MQKNDDFRELYQYLLKGFSLILLLLFNLEFNIKCDVTLDDVGATFPEPENNGLVSYVAVYVFSNKNNKSFKKRLMINLR